MFLTCFLYYFYYYLVILMVILYVVQPHIKIQAFVRFAAFGMSDDFIVLQKRRTSRGRSFNSQTWIWSRMLRRTLFLLLYGESNKKQTCVCGWGDDLCSLFALAVVLFIFIVASLSFTFLGFAQEGI